MADAIAELIALIGDENDRKAAEALFAKYEPLRGGVLRQSDYDRLMNEGKGKISVAEAEAAKWKTWADTNVPKHEELLKQFDTLESENQTLKQQVTDAATKAAGNANNNGGGGNTNIDPKEITRQVMAELGGKPASAKEISDMVAAKVAETSAAIQEKFFKETLPQANNWQGEMLDAQIAYHDEFGKRLDRKAFLKFMVDNKIDSPAKGLEMFTANDRNEAKIKVEVDKRVQDELSKRSMPGVSSGTTIEIGPLQTFLQGKAPKIPEGSRAGDGSLASQAADALRAEGKF